MNMNNAIRTNLCKGLRACGIPKRQTLEILNTVEKWYRENGPEWTNSRIKDLRQWYETALTGDPKPPKWFKHSEAGLPLGIWSWVFNLKPGKALGVLSLNTVFYEDKLSESQRKKFLHALDGNQTQDFDRISELCNSGYHLKVHLPEKMPEITFPTVFDMTGSIPTHDGQKSVRPNENLGLALKALRESWESVPQVTFDFLDRYRPNGRDLIGYMPLEVLGNEYQLELNRPHSRIVGRVSVLQQPQLKARIVGNPNRVTQVTLDPLKEVWMTTLRNLATDVTHDQESGVRWVQGQLRQGIELAGSDLTSASDLLDVRLCLNLVESVFGFPKIRDYQEFRDYFLEVSRGAWWCPALHSEVHWQQGDVLGTGPSFGLLSLTNNAAAFLAFQQAKHDGVISPQIFWNDSFRVVGDDIVMISQMEDYYTNIIEALGGEINHSKTLKSDKVAEFAGRIITSDCSYLKAVKYSEPSDQSFMDLMAQLGDQAKFLLRPHQRQAYTLFKEVPGIAVNGSWMRDSYGVPFSERYQWYLEEVQPALFAAEPDLKQADYSMELLRAQFSLDEAGDTSKGFDEPLMDDGYLPSQVTPAFRSGGDPRLTDGKTKLDILYQHVKLKDIMTFDNWKRKQPGLADQAVQASNTEDKSSVDPRDLEPLRYKLVPGEGWVPVADRCFDGSPKELNSMEKTQDSDVTLDKELDQEDHYFDDWDLDR